MKDKFLKTYPIFHRFTLFVVVVYIAYSISISIQIELPKITDIVKLITPDLNAFDGGSGSEPSDFVNNFKY